MNKFIVNFFSCIVVLLGSLILNISPVEAGHAEWHEGPSCGQCHCPVDYQCTSSVGGDCGCLPPDPAESE